MFCLKVSFYLHPLEVLVLETRWHCDAFPLESQFLLFVASPCLWIVFIKHVIIIIAPGLSLYVMFKEYYHFYNWTCLSNFIKIHTQIGPIHWPNITHLYFPYKLGMYQVKIMKVQIPFQGLGA